MAKIKSAAKARAATTVVDDEDDDTSEQVEVTDEAGETPEVADAASSSTETSTPVNVKTTDDDLVTFVPFEEVDPAPVVGHYKFRDEGVMKLLKGSSYHMPRHVALHLVDRKKGTIVSV